MALLTPKNERFHNHPPPRTPPPELHLHMPSCPLATAQGPDPTPRPPHTCYPPSSPLGATERSPLVSVRVSAGLDADEKRQHDQVSRDMKFPATDSRDRCNTAAFGA